jgi:hypothetical protein
VLSLLINEGELDIFAVMVFILLIDALDELFNVSQLLLSHGSALS